MKLESIVARTFMSFAAIGLVFSTFGCGPQQQDADGDEEREVEELIVTAAGSCGVERWAVKTGTDSTANLVNLTPRDTTIASL
ncbi:MAG TPA: hypothetical protein VF516_26800, partial [Kofleriaceae bacterium]